MADALDRRCGSCARFVRVIETFDDNGEVRRRGECLLGVWPAPLFETSTCSQWVRRGEFKPRPQDSVRARRPTALRGSPGPLPPRDSTPHELVLPEDLLDMDASEFRRVLRHVLREELGLGEVDLAGKWDGGEVILKPGKEGVAEKRIPIDSLLHKVVLIRDKLRVLEQKINTHAKLSDDDKVQLQHYVTGCYGSLTTFNVLFANREDQFVGQKGDE